MEKHFLKICSMILVIVLLVNMLPMSVFAEEFRESVAAAAEETTETVDTSGDYIVEEITEKRTEYTKEFLLSSGLHMATVYAEPVHYETDRGWEEIDNTLKTNPDGTYSNTEGIWDISLPQQLSGSESVTIEKDGYTLSFYMDGELNTAEIATYGRNGKNFHVKEAKKTRGSIQKTDWQKMRQAVEFEEMVPKKSKSRLTYADVYENTDIIYDLDSNMFKESIVLDSYSPTLQGYTYTLEVGDMIPVLEENGQITLYDKDRKNIVMVMPAPFLVDDAQAHSYDVQVQLTGSGSTYTLSYLLPTQWLAAEDRAWPVVLDPAVTPSLNVANIKDRTVAEKKTYAVNWGVNSCGYDTDTGIMRFYLMYNNLPCITSSDVVLEAEIQMVSTNDDTGKKLPVEVHKVNSTWTSDSITWANQPGAVDNVEDYAVVNDSNTYKWNITDIVRGWYANKNTGMVFKLSNAYETAGAKNFKQFYSSDYTDQTSYKPILTIFFRNNNGLESYWDYTTSSAGRAGTGYVNNFTGNMTWIHNDIGFDGNRMPVSINHVYNLNDAYAVSDSNNSNDSGGNSFNMGVGWRTNYNQLVYKWSVDSSYYVWEDSDGTDHYFALKDGVYKDEDGLELTLTDTGSGATKYCLTDKNGNCSYFDTYGRLSKISNNQQTKSSINITYYSTTRLITCITDGIGRRYLYMYENGLLDRIEYMGSGSTVLSYVEYSYAYENSKYRLETIKYKDGKVCTYDYNEKGLLLSAQDIDGYKLTYAYNSPSANWQPYRVQRVSTADGTASGGSLDFSYAHNQTTLTDHGNVQIMQFNDYGNTTCIQDDEGHAQYAQFAKNTKDDTGKSNQLRLSSDLQNTVGNRLKDGSFESGVSWTANSSSLTVSRSSAKAYIGSYSMKMVSTTEDNVAAFSNSFSVAPGETYVFSAYVKTEDAYAIIALQHGATYATYTGSHLSPNSGWTRLQAAYTNTSGETRSITPLLFLTEPGTAYVDGAQVEKAAVPSRYNLIENGDFRHGGSPAFSWTGYSLSSGDGLTAINSSAAPGLDNNVFKISGNPQGYKQVVNYVSLSGSAGDTYVLSGWAKANSVPIGTFDGKEREFEIQIALHHYDDTKTYGTVSFNPDSDSWQYGAAAVVAEKPYHSMAVVIRYNFNANTAYFDGIQLYKEAFGTSYTYDEDGNVKTVTDIQGQNTTYEYSNNNLIKQTSPNGEETTYGYDDYHNVETATTEENLEYNFLYDDWGNNTEVSIKCNDVTMKSIAKYTDNGNYLEYTEDALGNRTTYSYNADTGVLNWVQYPEDTQETRTEYSYDNMYRMVSAACDTNNGLSLSASYTYTNDLLTGIQTPSTAYSFTYGAFGQRTAVKVGNQTLASYTYTNDRNRYLSRLDYGNGDKVQYSYDNKGRVTNETFEDGSTVTYIYDNDGALAKVKDSETGITTTYYYDFTDQIVKYVETGSSYSHSVGYEYDDINNLTRLVEIIDGVEHTTSYTYDDDNRVKTSTTDSITVEYSYDDFGRVTTQTTKNGSAVVLTERYTYKAPTGTTTSDQIATYTTETPNGYSVTYSYTYDGNGNITSIYDGTNTTTYLYDSANQLVRENNQAGNYTYVWHYDDAGNIIKRMQYAYAADDLTTPKNTVNYSYGDSEWGDLLTGYNGKTLTYDAIGNLTNDGTWTYSWKHGRELAAMSNSNTTWTYTYDANGMRTGKSNGTKSYSYVYNGSQLSQMTVDSNTLSFTYDANGTPLTVDYNGTTYYYVTNLQGDVTAILDSTGTTVLLYKYDAWGSVLRVTGTLKGTLGIQNPLLYRGYVYDWETNLYYLQSRYYNPQIGRFINADNIDFLGASGTLLGYNLFAYCENNPINMIDSNGNIASNVLGAIIGGVLGIVGGAFLGRWLADIIGIKKTLARNVFVAGVAGLVGASAAAIGYFVGPYVAKAWNYLSSRLAGLIKGSFKGIGKISSTKMSKVNVKKHLWNKVLGKNVTNTNIQNLIYKAIRKGTWKIQSDGIYRIVMQYKKEYIVVTGNIVNGIFKLGDAWVWDHVSNLWGR